MTEHRLARWTGTRSCRALGATAITAALAVTVACSGSGGPSAGVSAGPKGSAPSVHKVDKVATLVPDAIASKGTITVVMSNSSPPAHFETDEGKMQGLDPDLAAALGGVMGLKVKVVGVPLDQVIPGLQAKRYDVVVSQFSPTAERAKVVDFVNYAKSGTSLGVASGNPKRLGFDQLCGAKVGVQKGSSQSLNIVPDMDTKCKKRGKDPVAMQTFRDSSTALLALQSSRVDGVLLDTPVLGYAVKQSGGKLQSVGTIDASPVAIGSIKGSGMSKPIQAALKELFSDGVYDKIFARWGLRATELKPDQFVINAIQE